MSELGPDDRLCLLGMARQAVEAAVADVAPPALPHPLPPVLLRWAGAFVSLHAEAELRGCIGYVEPRWPLAETVLRAAASAARDRRFVPVRAEELGVLEIELSVLGEPAPIRAEEIEVGVHGLIMDCSSRSGLLLPQVPVAYGWDRETFLHHLCRKAGLPGDSWRRDDARLLAFTAQVFSEPRRES